MILKKIKSCSGHIDFGREIVKKWSLPVFEKNLQPNILDVGCGHGEDLSRILTAAGSALPNCYGIESLERHVNKFPYDQLNIPRGNIVCINLEQDSLPFSNCFFDLVIANQVLEHTKELFWIFSELARVVKPGGSVILGVPNLASLHNRILLLMGDQPSCIETYGPHVRGFTIPALKRFIMKCGCFRIVRITGDHYYPFPKRIGHVFSRLFPGSAVLIYFLLERNETSSCAFKHELLSHPFETEFRIESQ